MKLKKIFVRKLNKPKINSRDVKAALSICDKVILTRLRNKETEEYYFREQKPKKTFYELMDFWETYTKYDHLLSQEDKKRFLIMTLVKEVDGIYNRCGNSVLLKEMSVKMRASIFTFCNELGRICDAKRIKVLETNTMRTLYQISLREFKQGLGTFQYEAIQNKLIETMYNGGMVVVIAGSGGVIPQRLSGYILRNEMWYQYPPELLEPLRDVLTAYDYDAKKRGELRGYRG